MSTTATDRERLLARVSDLLRRSGVEDAERLCDDLSRELASPRFSIDMRSAGASVATFRVVLPAGSYNQDTLVASFFRAAAGTRMTSDGVFPFAFQTGEIHLDGVPDALAACLYVRESALGTERARFPIAALFPSRRAVGWGRIYEPHCFYALDVWAGHGFVLDAPLALTLTLTGHERR